MNGDILTFPTCREYIELQMPPLNESCEIDGFYNFSTAKLKNENFATMEFHEYLVRDVVDALNDQIFVSITYIRPPHPETGSEFLDFCCSKIYDAVYYT